MQKGCKETSYKTLGGSRWTQNDYKVTENHYKESETRGETKQSNCRTTTQAFDLNCLNTTQLKTESWGLLDPQEDALS